MKLLVLLFYLIISFSCFSQENFNDPYMFTFKKISDDIYVAIRPNSLRPPEEGNCTIIINEEDVTIVDTSGSPRGADGIIKQLKKITNKPVRDIINTHWHGDHIIGNQSFIKEYSEEINIISHPYTRKQITAEKGGINYVYELVKNPEANREEMKNHISQLIKQGKPGFEKIVKHLNRYVENDLDVKVNDHKNLKLYPATITVKDTLILKKKNRDIVVFHPGKGDTPGDIWVYLPKEKLICTGDALTYPIPYGFSKYPLEWLEVLQSVKKMEIDILIPGHGAVQFNKKHLSNVISLLSLTISQIKAGIEKGLTKKKIGTSFSLETIEKKFTEDNPIKSYYFNNYFMHPNFSNIYSALMKIKEN